MAQTHNENESDWLVLARQGDDEAFAMLVERYLPKVYGLCLSLLGHKEDAEDCVQEVFIKAWKSIRDFKSRSTFYTWIYRIAINTCLDQQRSNSRRFVVSLDDHPLENETPLSARLQDDQPLPDVMLEKKELAETIRRAMLLLPESMREILILRDLQACSYQELADLLGISDGTVKSRLFRARRQLMGIIKNGDLEQNIAPGRPNSME